ncbi:MAG: 2-amino-4-hydroxy-6-hydroxymethyldihydropteridine diphosphokinase [Allorhizobium sp.]
MKTEDAATSATLGLGGNIGDPAAAMARALQTLDARNDCRIIAVSRLYRTPPWGMTEQADFYNCCARIDTVLDPVALLDACLSIEQEMKRVRKERWGPRTIDIDILTYGTQLVDTEKLQVPHPRMTERGFVLLPLADIAADLQVEERTVGEWLKDADVDGISIADADQDWWRRP